MNQKGVLSGKRAGSVTVSVRQAGREASYDVDIEGKKKVAIDAGHQLHSDSSTEPVGPGSSTRKAKVAGGATGVATGVPEYQLNLDVAKKLRKELLDRGYEVYMVRSKNNVNISNKKRAVKANKSGSDIYIRIHGDSSSSSSVSGASALYPSKSNPYVSKLSKKSYKLSKAIIDSYCEETGIKNRGCIVRDDLTGTNWSKIPVTLIEMGFMSNSAEDRKMQKKQFQTRMASGMADGIDVYFGY
ncbi:MAG TPA: N-acetylmuramoyl-L-alanine amidase [Lachnospiraceae bacterium]|nr:N-acetylmuramoyl-L-alanine amidase [Lachnospiraceae bacterium]